MHLIRIYTLDINMFCLSACPIKAFEFVAFALHTLIPIVCFFNLTVIYYSLPNFIDCPMFHSINVDICLISP